LRLKKFDAINVIPFIDIMLVILVIVLVTASFVEKRYLDVNLATAKSTTSNLKDIKEVVITIKKDNKIFLDKKEILKKDFLNKIKQINKESKIVINCDKKSAFESFLFVLDALKINNFKNILIVTKDE
jgi:biopolymer transport protein ExbD